MLEMSPRSMEALVGKQERLEDGHIFEAKLASKPLSRTTPSETALHEIEHGLLGKVRKISVVPGPGYLGMTELASYDAVAFAGPASQGRDGVGHDLNVISHMGGNEDAAIMAARIRLASISDEVKEKVAGHLQAEGTLSGARFDEAVRRAKTGEVVDIIVTRPDGTKVTTRETGVKGETVIVDFTKLLREKQAKKAEAEEANEIKGGTLLHFPEKPEAPAAEPVTQAHKSVLEKAA